MMTNTYTPFVGGVEKSIESFSVQYRAMGHRVLIVAPHYQGAPADERDVIRVPAIQHFNGTDFSVQLPIPGLLGKRLEHFLPDIIHSHHPFLVGDTALRTAAEYGVPLIFTFHTYYEMYTHYVPGDSLAMKRFAATLATGYANLCAHVFAPSASVREDLIHRGVTTPITVIPTGIMLGDFERGDGLRFRRRENIPSGSRVIGFVSRLAPEKNIFFLGRCILGYLREDKEAHCVIAGDGPSRMELLGLFQEDEIGLRCHFPGTLTGSDLADCYHSMDIFVFASRTETQGLVLTEALASGVPVAALDGPGVRDVVEHGANGFIVEEEREDIFSSVLRVFFSLDSEMRRSMSGEARRKATEFSMPLCARAALKVYASVISEGYSHKPVENSVWERTRRLLKIEWEIVSNFAQSIRSAINGSLPGNDHSERDSNVGKKPEDFFGPADSLPRPGFP